MLHQKTYMAQHHGPHAYNPKGADRPKWYLVDASGQTVGRLATAIARVITGKHKPTFTRHADTGDFVVVINADKVKFTGQKWSDKIYYRYSGYIGGLKSQTAEELLNRHPEEIIKKAVWGMTGKSNLARRQLSKLKVYASAEHPHQAQNPQKLPVGVTRNADLAN